MTHLNLKFKPVYSICQISALLRAQKSSKSLKPCTVNGKAHTLVFNYTANKGFEKLVG